MYASAEMEDENDARVEDQGVKEVKKGSLTEREVMGNMFALIGAGHGKLYLLLSRKERFY